MGDNEKKPILGLTEDIIITNKEHQKKCKARIDTGATTSSIDKNLAEKLELGPYVKTTTVVSSNGRTKRPSVNVNLQLDGTHIKGRFTIADRAHMKYKVLIGQNILKKGYLIDPSKE